MAIQDGFLGFSCEFDKTIGEKGSNHWVRQKLRKKRIGVEVF